MNGDVYRGVVQGAKSTEGQEREVIIWRTKTTQPPFIPHVCVSFFATEQSTVVFDLPTLLSFINMLADAGKVQE